jgi:predicted PhzF superfamily epimerase YddE/YHI9
VSAELWLVSAFVSERAAGNLTGVVFAPDGADGTWCHEVARRVRAPESTFLWRTGDGWRVRFFSPAEGEMTLCGQAMIASDAVLRARGETGRFQFASQVGPLVTEQADGLSWLRFPREQIEREPGTVTLTEELGPQSPRGTATVVDSGRRRAFLEVGDLETIVIAPARVLAFCRERKLTGLCFWARADDELRFRVFTISLEGGEDASTGGAVLGLLPLVEPRPIWRIEQGAGSRFTRGTLYLRADGDSAYVGGAADLVSEGRLRSARA